MIAAWPRLEFEARVSEGATAPPAIAAHRVVEVAHRRLSLSGHPALRGVACDLQRGVLTLRGRVSTYYLKQIAQTVVGALEGVQEVVNLIEVAAAEP